MNSEGFTQAADSGGVLALCVCGGWLPGAFAAGSAGGLVVLRAPAGWGVVERERAFQGRVPDRAHDECGLLAGVCWVGGGV